MEPSDRLGRGMAAVLGAAGLTVLLYGGYGVVQGTGALLWFAPRLKAGGALVAALGLPWLAGGALLWIAGGEAVRDAWMRRSPTRRWFGTLALGMVLSAGPGLLWWGWLPFAVFGGGPIDFAAAGVLVHAQFASAVLAGVLYFAWSRRLPSSREPFADMLSRYGVTAAIGLGVVALWMHEPQPSGRTVYRGKTAVEWAQQCHSDVPEEDLRAWSALEAMGPDAEPGWRWLVAHETGLGGRFASVWMSWCVRQKDVVGWFGDLRLDDGLAAPAFYALQTLRPVRRESVDACRQALRASCWGLPAQRPAQSAAANALVRMGPAARPAFFDLLDYVFAEQDAEGRMWWTVESADLFRHLGEVGIEPSHPRRIGALRRLTAVYEQSNTLAARLVVELDPGGPFGGPALSWLAGHACMESSLQPAAAEELETLGPAARPVSEELIRAMHANLSGLHPAWDFAEDGSRFDARALWRAVVAVAPSDALPPLLIAALQRPERGPRLVAAGALADGLVPNQSVTHQLLQLLQSDDPKLRSSGAWALAVQTEVPDGRVADLVRAVDWVDVYVLLSRLSKSQRDRVTRLLERAVAHPDEEVARIGAENFAEFHERSQELNVEESGAEK